MNTVKSVLQNDRTKTMAKSVVLVGGIIAAVVIPLSPML